MRGQGGKVGVGTLAEIWVACVWTEVRERRCLLEEWSSLGGGRGLGGLPDGRQGLWAEGRAGVSPDAEGKKLQDCTRLGNSGHW